MSVSCHDLTVKTTRECEIVDLTGRVSELVNKAGMKNGVAFLFVPGATGALTTIEYEPGLVSDFPAALERIVPRRMTYEHEKRWHDGNGHSHVRASLLGPDLSVPFRAGKLMLGTWQQIVFVEFDVRPRNRTVLVQLIGE